MLAFTSVTADALRNSGYRILITGASGWLGRALVEMLAGALGEELPRRVILCGSKSGILAAAPDCRLPVYPLADGLALLDGSPALMFHFAFLTKDRVGGMAEQAYVESNRTISGAVAQALASERIAGLMLASSGAVHDYLSESRRDGAANLYGKLKAEDESRFAELCAAASVRFVAPRIFNISGPHINKFDAYALSAIIVDALRGGPITLRANKRVYRSYFYIGDLLELAMRSLLDGEGAAIPPFFDTAGDEVVEVGELARKVADILDRPDARIIRPALEDVADDRYAGNPDTLRALLRRYEIAPLPLSGQISATAAFIAQSLVRG